MVGQLVVTALAVVAVVFAVLRTHEFWTAPKPTDRVWHFEPDEAAGVLPFLTVGMAVSTSVMAVAAWLGGGEDGAPPIVQTLVTCTIVPTLVITYVLGVWGRPRFLLPPALRAPEGRRQLHRAEILDVRPRPGEAGTTFFVAQCDCGWMSRDHPDEPAAWTEAEEHTPNVAPVATRPLG